MRILTLSVAFFGEFIIVWLKKFQGQNQTLAQKRRWTSIGK